MPYIKQEDRQYFDPWDRCRIPSNPGELNYVLTLIIKEYLGTKPNYQKFNDAIGALEGCKLELYRRLVVPYENDKIEENGDVY